MRYRKRCEGKSQDIACQSECVLSTDMEAAAELEMLQ
jgi:hypothetical protein